MRQLLPDGMRRIPPQEHGTVASREACGATGGANQKAGKQVSFPPPVNGIFFELTSTTKSTLQREPHRSNPSTHSRPIADSSDREGWSRDGEVTRLFSRQLHVRLGQLSAAYTAGPNHSSAGDHFGGTGAPLLRHFTVTLGTNHERSRFLRGKCPKRRELQKG
jgi:hypothetical protein